MKLELKHIQHYPIGLTNGLMLKYDLGNGITFGYGLMSGLLHDGVYISRVEKWFYLNLVKPILRPMSDLYREIDGKIGIVELAKMLGDFKELISIEIEEDNYQDGLPAPYYEVKYVSNIDDSGDIHATLVFCPDTCSFERLIIYNARLKNPVSVSDLQGCPIRCYYKFYEYLFENHYDVYDLIGQGLAKDKNSIQD